MRFATKKFARRTENGPWSLLINQVFSSDYVSIILYLSLFFCFFFMQDRFCSIGISPKRLRKTSIFVLIYAINSINAQCFQLKRILIKNRINHIRCFRKQILSYKQVEIFTIYISIIELYVNSLQRRTQFNQAFSTFLFGHQNYKLPHYHYFF